MDEKRLKMISANSMLSYMFTPAQSPFAIILILVGGAAVVYYTLRRRHLLFHASSSKIFKDIRANGLRPRPGLEIKPVQLGGSIFARLFKFLKLKSDRPVQNDKRAIHTDGGDVEANDRLATDFTSIDTKTELYLEKAPSTLTSRVANKQVLTWVDVEIERLEDEKWKCILKREAQTARPLFLFLNKLPESKIVPPKANVFEAFRLCPFDQVRVVIIGIDPYHGPNQAHGLAFSVTRDVAVPPSLKNIFKEARTDVGAKTGKHGNLESWAKQGVLLLNALLTGEAGTPLAHRGKGWEEVTDACITALSKEKSHLVFMLWGKPAHVKGSIVDRKKHLVITSSHPSPLGATCTSEPFLESRCFSRCNTYLKQNGLGEINWDVL